MVLYKIPNIFRNKSLEEGGERGGKRDDERGGEKGGKRKEIWPLKQTGRGETERRLLRLWNACARSEAPSPYLPR